MHDSNAQTGVSGVRVRVQRPERFQVRWRDPVDPKILPALWMFATIEGVSGLSKVRTVALWHAITFNFMRMLHQGAL